MKYLFIFIFLNIENILTKSTKNKITATTYNSRLKRIKIRSLDNITMYKNIRNAIYAMRETPMEAGYKRDRIVYIYKKNIYVITIIVRAILYSP